MDPKNKPILKDFLLRNLEAPSSSGTIEWVNKRDGIFKILWTHQSSGSFCQDQASLFRSWAIAKGRPPNESSVNLKQNFRMALTKTPCVVELKSFNQYYDNYRHFQFRGWSRIENERQDGQENSFGSNLSYSSKETRRTIHFDILKKDLIHCYQIQSLHSLPNSSPIEIPRSPYSPPDSSPLRMPHSMPYPSSFEIPRSPYSPPDSSPLRIPYSQPHSSSLEIPYSIPHSSSLEIPYSIPHSSPLRIPYSQPHSSSLEIPYSIPHSSSFEVPRSLPHSSTLKIPRSLSTSSFLKIPSSPYSVRHSSSFERPRSPYTQFNYPPSPSLSHFPHSSSPSHSPPFQFSPIHCPLDHGLQSLKVHDSLHVPPQAQEDKYNPYDNMEPLDLSEPPRRPVKFTIGPIDTPTILTHLDGPLNQPLDLSIPRPS